MTRNLGRAAGLVAIGALQLYWYAQPAAFALRPLTAAFTLLCLASPTAGLLAFAALAPVSSTIEVLAGGAGMSGGLMLEQLVLALGTGTLVRFGQPGPATRIGWPALLVAVVALASAAAMLPAAAAGTALPGIENETNTYLRLLLKRRDAYYSAAWGPVFAAVMVAECCLLGWIAERAIRRTPQLATRLIAILLVGHAAASLLNIERIVRMAVVLGGGLKSLPEMLLTYRISMQMDVHAAASALLLAAVAGVGLTGKSWVRSAGVTILLAIIAAGLWITGSRVAIGLGGVAAAVLVVTWAVRSFNRRVVLRIVIASAGAIAIAAGVWLATLYPSHRFSTTAASLNYRVVMAKTGIALFEQAPVFGIGIARFYGASAAIAGPQIVTFSRYPRENAHNNFIQVLAEQGVVGLAAMLLWLGVVLWAGWRARSVRPDRARDCLLLALVVCIGTWTMGHPLLVREFSVVFWLYAGILLAMTPPPTSSRWNLASLAFTGLILLSVPVRAVELRNSAELEHLGFGLSLWQSDDDDRRYRRAGRSFAVYLPARGAQVELPIRRAPGASEPLTIDVTIGGTVIRTISIVDDAWHSEIFAVPGHSRKYELVRFTVRERTEDSPAGEVLLRVGHASPR